MAGFQKVQLIAATAFGLLLAMPPAGHAQAAPPDPGAPPEVAAAPTPAASPEAQAKRLDQLFAELAEPGRPDWERVETEITRIWSHSGSPAMDLLLQRGEKAMAAEDYPKAVEHFSALIDHAPNFAEGWDARATAFYLMGNYALAIADIEHVLALNPRHFGALSGLSAMFETMDEPALALQAMRMAEKLNPNRPNVKEAVSRLEKMTGEVEI